MSNTKRERGPKDFGCNRRRLVGIWTTSKTSSCVKDRNMERMIRAEAVSQQINETYDVSLDMVCTDGILIFSAIKDPKVKLTVEKMMVEAIRTLTNPLTGEKFNWETITVQVLKDMIAAASGVPRPFQIRRYIKLSEDDVALLTEIFKVAYPRVCLQDYDKTIDLYKRLLGIQEPVDFLSEPIETED